MCILSEKVLRIIHIIKSFYNLPLLFLFSDTDVTVDEQHAGFSEQCELCMGRLAVFGTMSVLIAALLFSLVGCVFLFVRYQQSLKTKYKDTS